MWQMLILMLWLSLLGYQNISNAEGTKIVLATSDWEPYISETRPGHGKFAEIVSAVFKEMGMTTEFVFVPWKRVEALVKNGEAFAGIPYSYTEERHRFFDYSVPVMKASTVFFYNKKTYPQGISYAKLEDLTRYHISGVRGYWYEELSANTKLKIEYVNTQEQSITKLYFNRIDLAVDNDLPGWAVIKKLYPQQVSQFAIVEPPLKLQDLHLMVSRKYPNAVRITKEFNKTFNKLYAKGALPL